MRQPATRKSPDVAGQLTFDWSAATTAVQLAPNLGKLKETPDEVAKTRPQLALKWDFVGSFPEPTEEAIDAGLVKDEDLMPECIRAIHQEHAREVEAVLTRLDIVHDAKRRGVNPDTGKVPRTQKSRVSLKTRLERERDRLRHALDALIDVYAEAFGEEAARVFRSACEARHGGFGIVLEETPAAAMHSIQEAAEDGLPLAPPLRESVRLGAFGQEESGEFVSPNADEVEMITRHVAEELTELLPNSTKTPADYASLLSKYESDFGSTAARRLDAWVRKQVAAEEAED